MHNIAGADRTGKAADAADGSASRSREKGLSSRPSTPVAKSNTQQSLLISPDADEFSQNPKLLALIDKLAMQAGYLNAKDFGDLIEQEYKTQGDVIRKAGLGKK